MSKVKVMGKRWNNKFFKFFEVCDDMEQGRISEFDETTDWKWIQFSLWEQVFEKGLGGVPVGGLVEVTTRQSGKKVVLLRVEDSEEMQEIEGFDTWDNDISHQFLHDGNIIGVLEFYDLINN